MGSPCEISLYCQDPKQARAVTRLLLDEIERFENKYSRYKPTSITSIINQNAGKNCKLDLDEESALLIDYAASLFVQSDGLFDITSGILRRIWDFKASSLPKQNAIDALLPSIGWEKVLWDSPNISLPVEGMEIDFGGFVKEYVADVLATISLDNDVKHGLINLGGDIRVIGPHPDGSPWRVGIQHPRQLGTAIAAIDLWTGGVATSGDYERYMIVNGKRYSHLLNPITGRSIQPTFSSVSVVAESCLVAGSLSSIAMLKSEVDPSWLQEISLPYLIIDQNQMLSGTLGYS